MRRWQAMHTQLRFEFGDCNLHSTMLWWPDGLCHPACRCMDCACVHTITAGTYSTVLVMGCWHVLISLLLAILCVHDNDDLMCRVIEV